MKRKLIFFAFSILIISNSIAYASISTSDFCGKYDIIINGTKGILELFPGQNEKTIEGTYLNVETRQKYQVEATTSEHKITFFINFLQNKQMFEGYLMQKTKDAISGYTTVDGIQVGFYAIKEIQSQPVKEKFARKPLLAKSVYDKISKLRYILKDIRTTIMVYNGQHRQEAKLGFIWDEETQQQIRTDIVAQLLERTDRNGKGRGTKERLDFGPYFHEFPINPITLGRGLYVVDSPLPIAELITCPKDYDWIYNIQTCEFKAGGEEILPSDIPERREDNSLLDF